MLHRLWNLHYGCSIVRWVQANELDPLAEILVQSYLDTASYSRQFKDDYDQPPTVAAKAHHLRSIAQSLVNKHDQLELSPEYVEFGKLEVTDSGTGRSFLVRSNGAVTIERGRQSALFDAARYIASPVTLVVYKFHQLGMDLSVTGTRQECSRRRLLASGLPIYVATWMFASSGGPTFDQGGGDPFGDVGEVIDPDEGTGAA